MVRIRWDLDDYFHDHRTISCAIYLGLAEFSVYFEQFTLYSRHRFRVALQSSDDGLRFVYYESRKRELKIKLMNEGRCDERLKARAEESTCLTYTGLHDNTN